MPRKQTPGQAGSRFLPHIGQRMIKTAFAVFLCLILYARMGHYGADMPTEAAITAIICMQPYVQDARHYAANRMAATLVGAGWGLLFLLLLMAVPALGMHFASLHALMALGVLVCLYTSVAIHKPDASSLAAIVFICVVISFPEIKDPLWQAIERIGGVMGGTAVSIGVNVFHLPRKRNGEQVFFIRSADLVPDRFSQISPAVLFRLNSLLGDGARICLISRHAPAFFISQLSQSHLKLPMIVMDGAALYDVNENRYIWSRPVPEKDGAALMQRLDGLGRSYFLYTIHRNKTCIFHRGALSEMERAVMKHLRRSPYRSYLDEEIFDPDEIVCVKLIGGDGEIAQLRSRLRTFLRVRRLRAAIQPQVGEPGVSGLYIYSERATVSAAEEHLLALLRQETAGLTPVELSAPHGYRSEHDAMLLLYRLRNRYAPIRFLPRPLRERMGK